MSSDINTVALLLRQVSNQLRAARRVGLDEERRKTTDIQLLPALEQCG